MFAGVALLGVMATSSATGNTMDSRRTTYFTFSGPVQMPGVTLPGGTYIFEVVNHESTGDVVMVRSRDRSKVYLMQFTRFVHRPSSGNLKATVSLGETADGVPPPVKTWYPQFETRGREFIYNR
jgi:hypothetical protein